MTIGDWNARKRTIKLHQTPERTHAPAKTARQGRTPYPAQDRGTLRDIERFERTGSRRVAKTCRRASRPIPNGRRFRYLQHPARPRKKRVVSSCRLVVK